MERNKKRRSWGIVIELQRSGPARPHGSCAALLPLVWSSTPRGGRSVMRIPVRRLESLQPVALNPSHFFGFWFSSFGYDLGFSCFVTIVLVRTGLVRLRFSLFRYDRACILMHVLYR